MPPKQGRVRFGFGRDRTWAISRVLAFEVIGPIAADSQRLSHFESLELACNSTLDLPSVRLVEMPTNYRWSGIRNVPIRHSNSKDWVGPANVQLHPFAHMGRIRQSDDDLKTSDCAGQILFGLAGLIAVEQLLRDHRNRWAGRVEGQKPARPVVVGGHRPNNWQRPGRICHSF